MTMVLLVCIMLFSQANPESLTWKPAPDLRTGREFQGELDQAASGSWSNMELRSLLRKLSTERKIAVLLDRRIDPTIQLPVEISNQSLREGFQSITEKAAAELSVPENVVFIGPPRATQSLRTLIEIRTAELQSKTAAIGERRRNDLMRRHTFAWDDLDTPAEILGRIAEHYHVKIRNPDTVPHDLWAASSLPGVPAAEALSLILIQFDLTFQWIEGGEAIELTPIPPQVTIERRHRIKGRATADYQKSMKDQFPDLELQLTGDELLVRGTVEQQEAVAAALNPGAVKKPANTVAPLRQRTFTVTFKRVAVRAVMDELKKSRVVFVYDAAQLEAAGIDLDQTIDLDLTKATVDEFFKAMFTPLKLKFEIDNTTVRLTPLK